MSTYRELIYMVLDKVKESTDDAYFKEEHVAFLMDKYRPFLLKQRYADIRKSISQNNYSRFIVTLNVSTGTNTNLGITYNYTTDGKIWYSTTTMPRFISLNGETEEFKIFNYGVDATVNNVFKGDFSIVSQERFKYIGENKWLKKFAYATISPDYLLCLKLADTSLVLPTTVLVQGIVEDPKKDVTRILPIVSNYLDMTYPLEDALVPPLLELVVKDLSSNLYSPEDTNNNAKDDLEGLTVKSTAPSKSDAIKTLLS